uniref:Uncharacterized protein n=1 Tax=Rhizophora mucronata TaxID=61149 RepID=A0A2P2J5G2_RHIMU
MVAGALGAMDILALRILLQEQIQQGIQCRILLIPRLVGTMKAVGTRGNRKQLRWKFWQEPRLGYLKMRILAIAGLERALKVQL